MPGNRHEQASFDLSLEVYRFLLSLYPSTFRREYGELMQQAFRDSYLQARRQHSLAILAQFWGRIGVDTFLSVLEQVANRGAGMTKTGWIKLSGWSMAASGLLVVAGWLAGTRPVYNEYNALSWPIDRFLNAAVLPLAVLGFLLIGFGLFGLKAYSGRQAGSLGQTGLNISLAGLAAALVGTIGMRITDSSPWWELFLVGTTVLFIGMILFGIRCIQRKLFSRGNALPLLASVLWPLVILIDILLNSVAPTGIMIPDVLNGLIVVAAFLGMGATGYLLQADAGRPRPEAVGS